MSRLKAVAPADVLGAAGLCLLAIGLTGLISIFLACIAVGLVLLLVALGVAVADSA